MIREILSLIFLFSGFILSFIAAVGILKFKDFMSRIHAFSIAEIFGFVLMAIGFVIAEGFSLISAKILLIIVALMILNPVGTHLIAKAALHTNRQGKGNEISGMEEE